MAVGDRHGIFAGRFQPYHNGHDSLVRRYLELRAEPLVLAIVVSELPYLSSARGSGSDDRLAHVSKEHHEANRNPLSAWARVQMLGRLWGTEVAAGRISVVPVPRPQGPSSWWAFVTAFLPTSRFWVLKWAEEAFEREKQAFFREMGEKTLQLGDTESTVPKRGQELRAMLARGEPLDGYVPPLIAAELAEYRSRMGNDEH
jgi:nicotinamide mononucleotide adenylyltransferase